MLRISATLIDSFRLLHEEEYVKESEIIDNILGKPFERSWQAQAGSAWHSVLEDTSYWVVPSGDYEGDENRKVFVSDGHAFDAQDVVDARRMIGPGSWEVKTTKEYDLGGEPVTIVTKADHLHGRIGTDNKSKWGNQIDLSHYDNSLQWRFYLLGFDLLMFRYIVYAFREPDKNGYCHLKEIRSVKYYPYPGMEQDVLPWVRKFVDWVRSKGLGSYLHRLGTP